MPSARPILVRRLGCVVLVVPSVTPDVLSGFPFSANTVYRFPAGRGRNDKRGSADRA
ncbi:hypothetical protein GCM10010483_41020 [Actinokineospora diospyrosa]